MTVSNRSVEQWADPIIGLAVGSRFTTQGFASVGYRWTESISTALGYRAVYTDYRNEGFSYRATQRGVFSSIAYHF